MKEFNIVNLEKFDEHSGDYSPQILACMFLDVLRNNGLDLDNLSNDLMQGDIQDIQITVIQRRANHNIQYTDARFQTDRPIDGDTNRSDARYRISGLTMMSESGSQNELTACEIYDAVRPHVRREPYITHIDDFRTYIRTSDLAEPVQLTLL